MGHSCSRYCGCSKDYYLAKSLLKQHCYDNPRLRASIIYTGDLHEDACRLVQLRKALHEYAHSRHIVMSSDVIPLKSDSIVMMLNTETSRTFGVSQANGFGDLREDIMHFLLRDYFCLNCCGYVCRHCCCCCCCCCPCMAKRILFGIRSELNMTHVFSRPYFKYRLGDLREPDKDLPLHVCISLRPPFNNDTSLRMIYISVYHSS